MQQMLKARNKRLSTWIRQLYLLLPYFIFFYPGFCPEFRHILNGQVLHVSPKFGKAAVEFRCNEKYRLSGKTRLECINGRWNAELPFCESKFE